ncbi:(R)-mandelonitrile lyase [Parasedimentitalea maritima]|uniref:Cupin domain-containing protein n=1 Tax=Parasedimentitalea maritima TaxID=2578117 RepID=A0A6A4REG9_9RHOB|nr:cupin domain-containing protein [Zongyanglinia marina]KAE9628771.1 cupin domain-containing protein [Zongyanglinia marina]
MELIPANERQVQKSDRSWFTGEVWLETINLAPAPARHRAVHVTFEAGARTAWHSHPLGQTIYVVEGVGVIGTRDALPRVIRAGDSVWLPPGEEHWHGAAPDEKMKHISIQEAESGFVTTWMEHVAEEDYSTLAE